MAHFGVWEGGSLSISGLLGPAHSLHRRPQGVLEPCSANAHPLLYGNCPVTSCLAWS